MVVIVAGYEAAITKSKPSVWGHAWYLPSPARVDGVWVGYPRGEVWGYAQFGERHGRNQATIGLMAHEIGHLIFGLPDLYDTDYCVFGDGP